VKGKTNMWDVFPNDMGLDSSVKLALANMDINDPMLEPVTLEDDIHHEGSSSTALVLVPQIGLDDLVQEPKIGGESNGDVDDVDFDDDDMEPEDY